MAGWRITTDAAREAALRRLHKEFVNPAGLARAQARQIVYAPTSLSGEEAIEPVNSDVQEGQRLA